MSYLKEEQAVTRRKGKTKIFSTDTRTLPTLALRAGFRRTATRRLKIFRLNNSASKSHRQARRPQCHPRVTLSSKISAWTTQAPRCGTVRPGSSPHYVCSSWIHGDNSSTLSGLKSGFQSSCSDEFASPLVRHDDRILLASGLMEKRKLPP